MDSFWGNFKFYFILFSVVILSGFQSVGFKEKTSKIALKKNVSIEEQIQILKLNSTQIIGTEIVRSLQKSFAKDFNLDNETNLSPNSEPHLSFERWLGDYLQIIKSSRHFHSKELGQIKIEALVSDVNSLMKIKNLYGEQIRNQTSVRQKFLQLAIGMNAKLEAIEMINIGQSKDQISSLRSYLVTQATLPSAKKSVQSDDSEQFNNDLDRRAHGICFEDVWWNIQALRGSKYPIDLVANTLQLMQQMKFNKGLGAGPASSAASVNSASQWSLAKASLAYISIYLRTGTLLHKESEARIFVAVINDAMAEFSNLKINYAVENLRVQRYKWLMKSGETLEAQFVRSQIAWDQVKAKFNRIKTASSIREYTYFIFTFLVYILGYIFVATPIEVIVILVAIAILAKQGRVFFQVPEQKFNWKKPRSYHLLGVETFRIAWRMFVTSYTGTSVPFYSKVASSLLLFGIGLLFNGARLILESMVSQMAL